MDPDPHAISLRDGKQKKGIKIVNKCIKKKKIQLKIEQKPTIGVDGGKSQQTLLGYGIFLPSLKLNGSFVNLDPDPPGEKQLDPDLQKINAELQPLVSAMTCAGSFSFFGGG